MKRKIDNHWTDRLIDRLMAEGVMDDSETEAYRFGIEMLTLKMAHMVSYILIAAVMRKIPEFLIIFSVLCVFRRNTGGFHAETRLGCYLFSCIVIGTALLLCDVPVASWQMNALAPALLLIMNGCAPVRNQNRRMDDDEAACFRHRLKCETVVFSLVYVVGLAVGNMKFVYLLFIGIFVNTVLMILGKAQVGETT